MDNETAKTAILQFDKLHISPEIARRKDEGRLPSDFRIDRWQIVYFPDGRPPLIRLNSEAKIVAVIRANRSIAKGEAVNEADITSIEGLQLSADDDPDCGHASLVRFKEAWIFAFDFRYNKRQATEHLIVADQFFASAELAHAQQLTHPFADNLFSSAELYARAILLLIADKKFKQGTSHRDTQMRFNKFAELGNVPESQRDAFNKLSGMRNGFRYLKGKANVTPEECTALLAVIRDLKAHAHQVTAIRPNRSGND